MKREPLVIIGNGMAAARLVQELTACAPTAYAITVIGDEPGLAYNRILLSSVLSADAAACDLPLKSADWWAANGVQIISGVTVTSVAHAERAVHLSDGRRIPYSKLVFATGSSALRLPIPGAELSQVFVFRTLQDTEKLAQLAEQNATVAVIGGGLLGIEAAYGLAKRGARVTLVHLMERLMERQLDAAAAAMVKASLERRGISVLLEAQSKAILGRGQVEGLQLSDGRVIDCEAVVMAAGVKPNSQLAKEAGFGVNRGIVVDEGLQTGCDGVYAVGECAEVEGQCCGLVEPAYAQADTLARRLSGDDDACYGSSVLGTNLKVSGLPVFSAGNFLGGEGTSPILLRDSGLGLYKKFVTRNGVLEGAVLVGDTSDAAWYLKLIRESASISAFRSGLAFGEAYCSAPLGFVEKQAA
jgi:nitrite reductase (NADH) large subunit